MRAVHSFLRLTIPETDKYKDAKPLRSDFFRTEILFGAPLRLGDVAFIILSLGEKLGDKTFVVLSFEGPDRYSHAGGLGSRVTGLSRSLGAMGFETHLFFIGDPDLPGHEQRENGKLHLHRWCQWISRYHPGGVYDGEEEKCNDWNESLPPWLVSQLLGPKLASGGTVILLAEEWQTTSVVLTLHDMLVRLGWRDRVHLLWNANNIFGFHRIPWAALRDAATITTVSRYMKYMMWRYGVDARVIPNGVPEEWLQAGDHHAYLSFSKLFRDRLTLVKVARWDPDKRWGMAVGAVAIMKRLGLRPLLLARGGQEEHGREVLTMATQQGLRVAAVRWTGYAAHALTEAIAPAVDADMLVLEDYLSEEQRQPLFRVAGAVLANSGIEPFGLVGLETMAVGGVAFVGCTGEDYVTHRHDAISLQTSDPGEIVYNAVYLRTFADAAGRLRRAAKRSAARYSWEAVIPRVLLPSLDELSIHSYSPVAAST